MKRLRKYKIVQYYTHYTSYNIIHNAKLKNLSLKYLKININTKH